jgi:ABC-type branched-subunit amino acid transport system substrate-binding protein
MSEKPTGFARPSPGSRRGIVCLLTIMMLVISACGSGSGDAPPTPIRVGVIADFSQGPGSVNAHHLRAALEPAIGQINAAGGINGRPLRLIYADPKSDPAEAVAQARRLLGQERVDLIYGGTLDSECAALQELAGWLGFVYFIGSACGRDDLTAKTCNEFSFRLSPAGRQVIDPLAKYLADYVGKRWALVYRDYSPGTTQAADWRDSLSRAGASVTAEVAIPVNAVDVSGYLSATGADEPIDGIIVAGNGSDQLRLLAALRDAGEDDLYPIVGSGDWTAARDAIPNAAANATLIGIRPVGRLDSNEQVPEEGISGDAAAIHAISDAMIASGYSGKPDSKKLIDALELVTSGSSGRSLRQILVDSADHQGRMEEDIFRIHDQRENVLQQVSPDQLPPLGRCHV